MSGWAKQTLWTLKRIELRLSNDVTMDFFTFYPKIQNDVTDCQMIWQSNGGIHAKAVLKVDMLLFMFEWKLFDCRWIILPGSGIVKGLTFTRKSLPNILIKIRIKVLSKRLLIFSMKASYHRMVLLFIPIYWIQLVFDWCLLR